MHQSINSNIPHLCPHWTNIHSLRVVTPNSNQLAATCKQPSNSCQPWVHLCSLNNLHWSTQKRIHDLASLESKVEKILRYIRYLKIKIWDLHFNRRSAETHGGLKVVSKMTAVYKCWWSTVTYRKWCAMFLVHHWLDCDNFLSLLAHC